MSKLSDSVLDALDIETFLICENETEGKDMVYNFFEELGFKDVDIVFIQHEGPGVRVRARGYIYRPGDKYNWLDK